MTVAAQTSDGIELRYTKPQIEIFFNTNAKYNIITKGRRFGATKGAANAFIEWAIEGITPTLWVDTINSNIDRYVERYFIPELNKLKSKDWQWFSQRKVLKIFNSVIDFRSADAPESIEGFGYKKIFLNEAGIILKDDYLYSNSILPMLLDYPDSQLFAIGVPKGKIKRDGNKHKFFELYERCIMNEPNYKLIQYTSFDNPLINKKEIHEIADQMTDAERQQEIYGRFVEYAGENPFAHQFTKEFHESEKAIHQPSKQLVISVDFNLNPFGVIFAHVYRDSFGMHFHVFDECEIENGSMQKMIQLINERYKNVLHNAVLTGDAMGKARSLMNNDASSYFEQLRRGLNLRESQIHVTSNPTHENSRADCNYILFQSKKSNANIEVLINPRTATGLCRDLKSVQCDAFGKILKRNRNVLNQRADLLDCWRYIVNSEIKKWILESQKINR
jgi:hypothetical protein